MRKTFPLNKDIKELGKIFHDHGYRLYLVGGAVRDWLIGIGNDDYDFTSDATPEEVMALFPHHTIPTGLKHGTVTVRFRKTSYEVTTFRSEGAYSDSRHPDSVTFVKSLESDLERRDFTINAFAADCTDGRIVDLHDGYRDLKRHLVRAIGRPEERFEEDALRMLRSCRFASRLDFDIEEATFEAMKKLCANIVKVSAERIRQELFKIIEGPHPVKGIELMRTSGLLHYILPELEECAGVEQLGFHQLDVYQHLLASLDSAARHDFPLPVRLAALFHDIAKPQCRREREDGDGYTFYGHDKEGGKIAFEIMSRLKCSNEERDTVALLVREHMFSCDDIQSEGAVRRFINRVGRNHLDWLFELRICDAEAIERRPRLDALWALEERVQRELERKAPLSVKDLAVNGNDLMQAGIERGPELGKTLNRLLEAVLDDASLNTKERLMDLVTSSRHQGQ